MPALILPSGQEISPMPNEPLFESPFTNSSSESPSIATWSVAWIGAPASSSAKRQLQLMDSNEDSRSPASPPSSASAVPDLYEVFSTPYTKEDVARGVRVKQNISRGVLVEVAHCIRIPHVEYEQYLRSSVLEHYLYVGRKGDMLMALGVGSLFNHSQQPNLNYTIDHEQLVIKYRAARAIAPQEELTITYGSSSELWFEDRSVDSTESSRPSMMHEYLDDENAFFGGLQIDSGEV